MIEMANPNVSLDRKTQLTEGSRQHIEFDPDQRPRNYPKMPRNRYGSMHLSDEICATVAKMSQLRAMASVALFHNLIVHAF
jgi:hypothetical protein